VYSSDRETPKMICRKCLGTLLLAPIDSQRPRVSFATRVVYGTEGCWFESSQAYFPQPLFLALIYSQPLAASGSYATIALNCCRYFALSDC
jgi:hypothetical protein